MGAHAVRHVALQAGVTGYPLPRGAQVLSVARLNDQAIVFVLVDIEEKRLATRVLAATPSGAPAPAGARFVGTIIFPARLAGSADRALHVFEAPVGVEATLPAEPVAGVEGGVAVLETKGDA